MSAQAYDVDIDPQDGFILLTPITMRARNWFTCHIEPDAITHPHRLGVALVLEPEYLDDILDGIKDAGLTAH